jgi:hypothetical protein
VLCVVVETADSVVLVEDLPGSDERTIAIDAVVAGGGPATTAALVVAS